jgi:hypothetical protein
MTRGLRVGENLRLELRVVHRTAKTKHVVVYLRKLNS